MNRLAKHNITTLALVIGAAIFIPGVATSANSANPNPSGVQIPMNAAAAQQRMDEIRQQQTQRLETLRQDLNLRPDQLAAWQAFADAQNAVNQPALGNGTVLPPVANAPERFKQMEQLADLRLAHAKALTQAASDLYALLDDAQRASMDKSYAAGVVPKKP